MEKYNISACIVTHNNMLTIKNALDSLLENTKAEDFKLYVVDNGSTDGTADFIQENYPSIELIRNTNTGFGAGHNVVIPKLDSKYHFVINPDIIIRDDVISKMASYMDEHEDIGQLAPKICFPDGRIQVLAKRSPKLKYLVASRLRTEGEPSKALSDYAMLEKNYDEVFDTEVASGCFFAVRTDVFKKIGGFDEKYFLYFEDFDLSRQIGLTHRIVFYPDAIVYHEWGRESKKNFKLMLVQIRSMFYFFSKWR